MVLEGREAEPDGMAEVWVEVAEFSDMVDSEEERKKNNVGFFFFFFCSRPDKESSRFSKNFSSALIP